MSDGDDVHFDRLHAAHWRNFLKTDEKQRVEKLELRIENREWLLAHDRQEKKRIMNRAIRRKRRAQGKK